MEREEIEMCILLLNVKNFGVLVPFGKEKFRCASKLFCILKPIHTVNTI